MRLKELEGKFQLALNYLDWMSAHSMDVSDGTLEEIQQFLKKYHKLPGPSMLESLREVRQHPEPAPDGSQLIGHTIYDNENETARFVRKGEHPVPAPKEEK